jgi:hypothetical protein
MRASRVLGLQGPWVFMSVPATQRNKLKPYTFKYDSPMEKAESRSSRSPSLWLSVFLFVIYFATLSVTHKVFGRRLVVNNWKVCGRKRSWHSLLPRPHMLGGVFVSSPSWGSGHDLNLKLDRYMNSHHGASSLTRDRVCSLSDVSVLSITLNNFICS